VNGLRTMTRSGVQAGVLGHPVSHSLSPVLHRAAYEHLGLDWNYQKYDVAPDGLEDFMSRLDETWVGVSVTMPHKTSIVAHLDFVESLAKLVGVVNTVAIYKAGAHLQRVGVNTDVYGIKAALGEAGVSQVHAAAVVGGGATATSAVAALGELGCTHPLVVVRNKSRAGGLMRACAKMGVEPRFVSFDSAATEVAYADVVISTVPAEVTVELGAQLPAHVSGVLLDAVYDPLRTPLMDQWELRGGVAVSGTRMLLHQAAEQVRLWTGVSAPVKEMERALVANISQQKH